MKILLGLLILILSQRLLAGELSLAVASNFASPMKEIVKLFESEKSHRVSLSFGSSGKFYAQIANGAPFEIFFSADQETPKRLGKNGFAMIESQKSYARGRLVLWSSKTDFVDAMGQILESEKFKKIAIANSKVAPYGRAADDFLSRSNLLTKLKPKMVVGENVAQTYEFIASGNVELGFVSLSQVIQNKKGSYWEVPVTQYEPVMQDYIVLNAGKSNPVVREFIAFVSQDRVRQIIRSYGYLEP